MPKEEATIKVNEKDLILASRVGKMRTDYNIFQDNRRSFTWVKKKPDIQNTAGFPSSNHFCKNLILAMKSVT